MAKSGKSTAVDSRKAASAKKQQEKQAARRRAKEEKLAKKSERVFAKSLASFEKSSAERARAFVDQQLDDNPGWVRPLADLMRDGALQALIRSGAAEAEGLSGGPRRWSGKAKSFGCLRASWRGGLLFRHRPPARKHNMCFPPGFCLHWALSRLRP